MTGLGEPATGFHGTAHGHKNQKQGNKDELNKVVEWRQPSPTDQDSIIFHPTKQSVPLLLYDINNYGDHNNLHYNKLD